MIIKLKDFANLNMEIESMLNRLATTLLLLAAAINMHAADLPLDLIKLPPGFKIELYVDNVPNARSLELAPGGTLFIGTRSQRGPVFAVVDSNKDFRGDAVFKVDDRLYMPNGVAFRDGSLYVAEINRILRYDNIESKIANPPEPVTVFNDLPSDRHHGWKFIRFGPDGRLYVPIGAPCNICEPDLPYATIYRINHDGTNFELYASGIRNTVGFDWNPITGKLWFTDNGRDNMGDDLPPDELNRIDKQGQHFGYPYWHGAGIQDPEFGSKRAKNQVTLATQPLDPHVAAIGMRFYTGEMFPAEYKNQILIAEHGSWNRSKKIGYRLTMVKLENDNPVSYDVFASGWLQPDESVWGRPVDIEQMPDGSLLVSDDRAGVVYRISYSDPVRPSQSEPLRISPDENIELAADDPSLLGTGFTYRWTVGIDTLAELGPELILPGNSLVLGEHTVRLEVRHNGEQVGAYSWQVTVTGPEDLSCDFSGDGEYGVIDVIALLLKGHYNPLDPDTDYNRDGEFGVDDVLGLIGDLKSGACAST
jgi:glucose/arabinose dehydrogenase